MVFVAIETSSANASIALLENEQLLAAIDFTEKFTVGAQILTQLDELFSVAATNVSELTGIAVSVGPGAYTGIRLGVTAAKTLAFARRVPVVGVESLRVMAAGLVQADPTLLGASVGETVMVATILDGRQSFLYGALYEITLDQDPEAPLRERVRQILPQSVDDGAALWRAWAQKLRSEAPERPMIAIGSGADLCLELVHAGESLSNVRLVRGPTALDWPQARVLGLLASSDLAVASWDAETVHRTEPLYLRATEAERKAMEAAES